MYFCNKESISVICLCSLHLSLSTAIERNRNHDPTPNNKAGQNRVPPPKRGRATNLAQKQKLTPVVPSSFFFRILRKSIKRFKTTQKPGASAGTCHPDRIHFGHTDSRGLLFVRWCSRNHGRPAFVLTACQSLPACACPATVDREAIRCLCESDEHSYRAGH